MTNPGWAAHKLPLLTTKLYIPPPRPNLVSRPRLGQRLDEGLARGHLLTLVSAQAGFGKTTLITDWICGLMRDVAWLSLDEGDNDPVQFVTYVVAALQQVDGRIGRSVQQFLGSPQSPPVQILMTALLNDISAAGTPLALVLDDYHLIDSPAVHDAVGFVLDHQPSLMHLVISARQDPPLPLSRLRARGQVTEIRERDLRFSREEAAAFLQQTMGLRLADDAVGALESRTEGWVAGLQLAAVAIESRLRETPPDSRPESAWQESEVEDLVRAFAGDDRHVVEYLVGEVLHQQPEALREFLCHTAILDQLSASLCDAVTGREDSEDLLEELDRKNLFIVPLDNRREWYRYHRLFVDALRATIGAEQEMHLHMRAARWYERHGYPGQAIRHALAYARASGDWDDAVRLVRTAAGETMLRGGVMTARGWLQALPNERVRADGELATYMGWALALTGDMALAEEHALCPEVGADPGKRLALRGFIAVFGHQAYEEAIELAAGALEAIPEDQAGWRVTALWVMAESQERTTHISEAIATLRQAQITSRRFGSPAFAVTVELFLAAALHNHGRRRQAMEVCLDAIDWYSDERGQPSLVAGMLLSRLGMLYYEANQLDEARTCLDQGLALSEQLGLAGSSMLSLGFSAPTLHAQGETTAALRALREAHRLAVETGLADADWSLALEANIHLQQGDLPAAQAWAAGLGLSPDDEPGYLTADQYLVYAQLLLVQGRLAEARGLLARLERMTRDRGLNRWLISVRILQALVAARLGDAQRVRDHLALALETAAPEEYVRAFVDEGPAVAPLLSQVRDVNPDFVDRLLSAFEDKGWRAGREEEAPRPSAPTAGPCGGPALPLIEPLSNRELEVVGLIAAGLTNREIAQELVIAVGTVKRHTNNIYGKLGVQNRTQAVARVREFGLL